MKNRSTTDTVNRDPVDQVSLSVGLSRADRPREKTKGVWLNSRKTKPADIKADTAGLIQWEKYYRGLWELKLALEANNNR